MKSSFAVDDAGATGGRTRKLDPRFDGFRSGIQEKYLVEIRHPHQQPLGKYGRKRRYIHLNEIGELAIEYVL